MRFDVAIMGSGPAGLALARACIRRGLSVVVVAPEPEVPWTASYAAWDDEVSDPVFRATFEATWAAPSVYVSEREQVLDRRYARFSTPALQAALLAGVGGVEAGLVLAVEHDDQGATLRLVDRTIEARVAVDATGAASRFLERRADTVPAWQVAHGRLVEVDEHPWFEGEMVLMDWRPLPASRPHEAPSFLYAMPLGRNVVFLEETSLAARPAASLGALASRLDRRILQLGLRVRDTLAEERCRIPMGLALPRLDQRTLGFGVAAGLVHPATGYQVARSLAEAPALAEAIALGLEEGGPALASQRGWATLWPRERRIEWELYAFGLDFLTTLDAEQLRAFFGAFFSLETRAWSGFLSGTLGAAGLARAMGQVFAHLDAPLRWELMRAGVHARAPFQTLLAS
jgi:capsanthin/capsorubin synthase